jgi:hypothetical protein
MCSEPSFDHLVGAARHRERHGEPKRLGGLQVDDQLDLLWTAGPNREGRSSAMIEVST